MLYLECGRTNSLRVVLGILIGLGMDAVNRIKEHDELNQVTRHIPPPEFKTV